MKLKIEVECTPEEARTFLGFPDMSAVHGAMIEVMQENMKSGFQMMDAETVRKMWFPMGTAGMDAMQTFMSKAMAAGQGGSKERDPGKKDSGKGE